MIEITYYLSRYHAFNGKHNTDREKQQPEVPKETSRR